MELQIGPYEIIQRTKYSKIRVTCEGNDIEIRMQEKILSDYNEQIKNPNKYFIIEEDKLKRYINTPELNYVFIPDGTKHIDNDAFGDSEIKFVSFPDSLLSIGRRAFRNCMNLEEVIIPDSVERIEERAFENCAKLKKVVLPSALENLPKYIFHWCGSLNEVVLPCTIKEIEEGAFIGCESLEKINIPRDLEYVGGYLFVHSGLTTLYFDLNLKENKKAFKAYGYFLKNTPIIKLEITKDVEYINPCLFCDTDGIKEINYFGSKKEFSEFKKNNKELFRSLNGVKVNIKENLEDLIKNATIRNSKSHFKFFDRER